jgi:hypothetical protein
MCRKEEQKAGEYLRQPCPPEEPKKSKTLEKRCVRPNTSNKIPNQNTVKKSKLGNKESQKTGDP